MARGQLVGLLGPSGCGKSTLMRSIVGVQRVTGGRVEVFGQPAGSSWLRSRIGYLTQQPSVYQDLTVIENLRYFAKVIGLPRKKLDDEVSRLLSLVDLADHASARAGSLSGGELSRVSLAAALVGAPELLVLDEPTVGLDPVLRRDLWSIFRRLTQAGVTLLVSSHVMDEAVRCDRLLLMRNGTMLADDTLRGVLECNWRARSGTGVPHPRRSRCRPASSRSARWRLRGRRDIASAGWCAGMTPTLTMATATRVLQQIRHDHRTLGLMLIMPCVLLGLLAWIYQNTPVFDSIGAPLLGIFPFLTMFLVTSIATLRERQSGTLERLLAMPLGKGDMVGGYALAFGLLATVQAVVASGFALLVLGLDVAGSAWLLLLVAVVDALLGTALGLFLSAFAATEFQAVQFLPAFVLPQFLLCGLLVPRDQLPTVLEWISDVLPLSYAVDAMQTITSDANGTAQVLGDVAVVLGFVVALIGLGAATLRRQTS